MLLLFILLSPIAWKALNWIRKQKCDSWSMAMISNLLTASEVFTKKVTFYCFPQGPGDWITHFLALGLRPMDVYRLKNEGFLRCDIKSKCNGFTVHIPSCSFVEHINRTTGSKNKHICYPCSSPSASTKENMKDPGILWSLSSFLQKEHASNENLLQELAFTWQDSYNRDSTVLDSWFLELQNFCGISGMLVSRHGQL